MSKRPPISSFKKSEYFIDAVRELKEKNRALALKLGQEMNKLAYSEYPNRLGEKKLTKYGEAYVMDIEKSGGLRLSYLLDFQQKIITIIRFGDHKAVYGKD